MPDEVMEMEYAVGDKILYPNRGAGTITGVEHDELVDGFENYYVIDIQSHRLTLRIPTNMMSRLGVRPVMREDALEQVWITMGNPPTELPGDFKERQEQVRERLRSGDPMDIAEAVRDLSWREKLVYLTKADARLLGQARDLLVDEVSLMLNTETVEAELMLDEALGDMIVEEEEPAEEPAAE